MRNKERVVSIFKDDDMETRQITEEDVEAIINGLKYLCKEAMEGNTRAGELFADLSHTILVDMEVGEKKE
jgi:hypothetical protein